jgi:hypothetical protein
MRELGNSDVKPLILQNETQGEGNPLLDSFRKLPDPSIIRIPIAPASGFDCINEMHLLKQSSGIIVSGFKNRI